MLTQTTADDFEDSQFEDSGFDDLDFYDGDGSRNPNGLFDVGGHLIIDRYSDLGDALWDAEKERNLP